MPALPKERVLLVDDEPKVLVALEDLLGDKFAIVKTTSADDALRVLEQEQDIAVVVTDQRMPKMTGDQLLAKLGPDCRALRIMVTGFADLGSVVRAVNDGRIFAYITKPWDADDLRDKVDRAVETFRSTKELVDERQLLSDLLENSPDGIYLKDRELRFAHANRAFAARCQQSELRLLGRRQSDVLADKWLVEQIESEEQRVLESGEPALDVVRAYSERSGVSWFSESRAPVRGKSGNVVGLLAVCRDVTERVVGQHALADSEARLRTQTQLLNAILDNLAEGVLVADSGGEFLLFNRQAKQLLGQGSEGLNARSWAKACGCYQLDRKTPLSAEDDPLQRAIAGEAWTELEIFVRNERVPGSHMIITATPLIGQDGSLAGGILLLRDVTAHKALEQRLAQAHKLEAVGRLAGGIAHDFNNLLSVIQGCTGMLLASPLEGEQRSDLTQVMAASERAANLTKQLMLFSRQQIASHETLQINDLVTQLTVMLSRILGEDITFSSMLDPALRLVKADRSQIEQIIVNLTINARDAMPNGGKLTISTRNASVTAQDLEGASGVAPGEFAVVTVSDTGIGMDAQTQARMYEPFYTTKEVGKGTGLGLATVYGIVRQSGGFVTCDSQPNRGATFHVHLPAARASMRPSANAKRTENAASSTVGTILLVEDEDAVRMIAMRMLRMQGYRVLEARKASEARRIWEHQRGQIDLLLTDIVMPGMSGTQLAETLRAQQPELRVLFMSGYAGAAAPATDAARPNVWFLEKPFTATTLLEKVDEALKAPLRSVAAT